MNSINVSFETFKTASNQFRSVAEAIKEREAQLKSTTENLMSSWEGKSKKAFENEYRDLVKSMYNYDEMLREMAKELDGICESFREADDNIARNLSK